MPYPTVPTAPAGYGFNLYPPGKIYSDRVNITDVRFGKIVNFKGTRMNFAIDLLNVSMEQGNALYRNIVKKMFDDRAGGQGHDSIRVA